MLRIHKPKGLTKAKFYGGMLYALLLLNQTTLADAVYRCGEAYSTSSQCGNSNAGEVHTSSVLHATEQADTTRDLREAQALEKQRLQAERQSAQAAPIRFSPPNTPSAAPLPSSVTHNEPVTNQGKHRGKHTRKSNSPYFTAVDPTAAPKKKSSAKASPSGSASSQ
jgi:hypothetical protein